MPQIKSNFKLRAKLPNFERDSFETIESMRNINPDWIDDGHISYCVELKKHFQFDSNNEDLGNPKPLNMEKTEFEFQKDSNGKFGFGHWRDLTTISNATYVSEFANNRDKIFVSQDLGGINKNTKLEEIDNKSFNQIFDQMLFPIVDPIINNPKISIKFKENPLKYPFLKNNIWPIMEGIKAPIHNDFECSTDYGSVILNGQQLGLDDETKGHYAGKILSSIVYCENHNESLIENFVEPGTYIYKCKMELDNGNLQPLNNRAEPVGEVWKKQVVDNSEGFKLEVTYPIYVLVGREFKMVNDLIKWEPVVGDMRQIITLQGSKEGDQSFMLPRPLEKVQMWFCEGFTDANIDNYVAVTEDNKNPLIAGHTYYKYIYNGPKRGPVKLKIYY